MAHLKRGPGGHLLHGPIGHLVNSCDQQNVLLTASCGPCYSAPGPSAFVTGSTQELLDAITAGDVVVLLGFPGICWTPSLTTDSIDAQAVVLKVLDSCAECNDYTPYLLTPCDLCGDDCAGGSMVRAFITPAVTISGPTIIRVVDTEVCYVVEREAECWEVSTCNNYWTREAGIYEDCRGCCRCCEVGCCFSKESKVDYEIWSRRCCDIDGGDKLSYSDRVIVEGLPFDGCGTDVATWTNEGSTITLKTRYVSDWQDDCAYKNGSSYPHGSAPISYSRSQGWHYGTSSWGYPGADCGGASDEFINVHDESDCHTDFQLSITLYDNDGCDGGGSP